ncbi:MAG: sugar transferase [Lunatimonas sp.]|uniref:sugar transferase n=1 Tax=Lunatimonas sp. TaxID=2060141 RepID=UPI00263AE767|nr:sugar transferase [Lunatimonas sp.]MCC5939704.1 sugar transferase [Lunatimonas sp.]
MENVLVKRGVGQLFEKAERAESHVKDYQGCLSDSKKVFAKRVLDLAISSFTIVFVMSWLFPLVAIAIKATSKGPILFKQQRHGLNNKPFFCYKFRTMVVNKEADIKQATKGDSRVTVVGRFLRMSSIDELPQIFNVLKGEMAIVGPRPHAVPMNMEFAREIDNFMSRHNVKPGITGLAQSKGFRGEIRNFNDIYFRYRLDEFYVRKWCLLFDLKIIWTTIKLLVLGNENAY